MRNASYRELETTPIDPIGTALRLRAFAADRLRDPAMGTAGVVLCRNILKHTGEQLAAFGLSAGGEVGHA